MYKIEISKSRIYTATLIEGQIPHIVSVHLDPFIIKLIKNLRVIQILTKFGADWFIFVDARV